MVALFIFNAVSGSSFSISLVFPYLHDITEQQMLRCRHYFFCAIKPNSEPFLLFETVQFYHDRFLNSFVAVHADCLLQERDVILFASTKKQGIDKGIIKPEGK